MKSKNIRQIDELRGKTIYIAGKISGEADYGKKEFATAEKLIKARFKDITILNPTVLPENLAYDKAINISSAMLREADCIYFLDNWEKSKGAKYEMELAKVLDKKIEYIKEVREIINKENRDVGQKAAKENLQWKILVYGALLINGNTKTYIAYSISVSERHCKKIAKAVAANIAEILDIEEIENNLNIAITKGYMNKMDYLNSLTNKDHAHIVECLTEKHKIYRPKQHHAGEECVNIHDWSWE